tara:strand:+ start:58963 stop:59763 length:801 start_codon:yes stop_codon:yes gene_type:complete
MNKQDGLELITPSRWRSECYGYIRVSTKDQIKGKSLEMQKEAIRAEAKRNNLELVKIYSDEGISGTSMQDRANLEKLLKLLDEGETVIGYSVSRISRSVDDFTWIVKNLNRQGCRLILIKENMNTENPYSRCILAILSAFSELEAEMIKERVSDAIALKQSRGEHVGRIPYGWVLANGKGSGLKEVPEEQEIIARIRQLKDGLNGATPVSLSEIARVFNREKVPLPGKTSEWTHPTVSRIYKQKPPATKGRNNNNVFDGHQENSNN